MGRPVISTYYFTPTAFPGTNFGGSTTTPTATNLTTWGWVVGNGNPVSSSTWCQMDFGVEVARTSTQWKTQPTQSAPDNAIGNCWVIGPFNGDFAAATMSISMSIRAVTNASSQAGRFIWRIWKADNATGTIAPSLITSSFLSSSLSTGLTTTAQVLSGSFVLPAFSLHHEWIFIHTQWGITTVGSNPNSDADFVLGAASSSIRLPQYTSHQFVYMPFIQDDFPA